MKSFCFEGQSFSRARLVEFGQNSIASSKINLIFAALPQI